MPLIKRETWLLSVGQGKEEWIFHINEITDLADKTEDKEEVL